MSKCDYCGCWCVPGNKLEHTIKCPHDKIKELHYRFKVGNITEEVMNQLINDILDR